MHSAKVTAAIIALTAAIIASGLFALFILSSSSKKLDESVLKIEDNTRAGEWKKAEEELKSFKENWGDTRRKWAMLLDHIEIDNIDSTTSRMSEYIKARDTSSALAEIAELRQFIKHIPEKEAFSLKNIF